MLTYFIWMLPDIAKHMLKENLIIRAVIKPSSVQSMNKSEFELLDLAAMMFIIHGPIMEIIIPQMSYSSIYLTASFPSEIRKVCQMPQHRKVLQGGIHVDWVQRQQMLTIWIIVLKLKRNASLLKLLNCEMGQRHKEKLIDMKNYSLLDQILVRIQQVQRSSSFGQ